MVHLKEELHLPPNKLGTRHVQSLLLFLGMAIAYALRVCMSVAIVAMRNKASANPDFPEYDWDSNQSSLILSSFFWGYVITQVPSGQLASTNSARKLLAFGIGLSSLLNMLVPLLAGYGYIYLISLRVAMGLCQGCLLPCVQTLLSRWVPPLERARLGSFVMNGPQFGTVVTMPVSGLLAASGIGWPSIFYIFGAFGVAWSALMFCMGADHPSEHPRINPKEALYINNSLGNLDKAVDAEKPKVPWLSIITSVPMWALIIVHCGHNWGFYTLLTEMPSYMKSVLKFDITQSGGISALPYLAMWLLGFPISYLSDFALRKGLTIVAVRKISNTIGLWIPAAAMIVLCVVVTTDKVILVAILVVAVGFNCGITCGFQINHIDLSPNFAGPMMSITNGLANILGIVAPLICGAIVNKDEGDVNLWHIVFYITAAIYFVTNLVFVIFGKAEIQSWNDQGGEARTRTGRVSVISITGEPTSVSIPDRIKEEEANGSTRC
ncbi:putative inorganic phosphate cotransporter [Nasonia vitripennis]|uniref:Putative inorganic phosphate cotransporter n=1 Tax=Nasonia vitripennis TaxID=7425 RepID=A0A7M7IN49_NASVI|nr:putative inorganic phosphate cotransporter [Nasonia vitripennis]